LFDTQGILGLRLDLLRNAVTVEWLEAQRVKDEHVERAFEELVLLRLGTGHERAVGVDM
jgi:hypothetical protein